MELQRKIGTLFLFLQVTSGFVTWKLCPDYCHCTASYELRSAACNGQNLPNIETGVPSDVENLTLSNNSISFLKDYGFKELQLTFLVILNLSHNHIGSIGLHAFAEVLHLEILDLSSNYLHYLHRLTFEDTPKLRILHLSANKIKMSADPFLASISLQILDLARCHLDSVWSESFSMLPSITNLNLSNNQLIGLDVKALELLKNLKKLDLRGNPFSCDGKATKLQVWLDKHYIQHWNMCKNEKKNEEMFQKIILANYTYNQTMTNENIPNGWFSKEPRDELLKCKPSEPYFYAQSVPNGIDKIPSFWALLIGFELGFASALFGTWIWLSVCSKQNKLFQPIPRGRGSWYQINRQLSVFNVRNQQDGIERLCTEQEHVIYPVTSPLPFRDAQELETFNFSYFP